MMFERYKFSRFIKCKRINKILIADECSSTMNLAKIWSNESENLLIISEQQSAGRGQKQKTWASPKNSGIWMTIILNTGALALAPKTALAIVKTLEELGCPGPINIKWPNDIYISGKKTAGILIEGENNNGSQRWVIGIGITINQIDMKHIMPLAQNWQEIPERCILINKLIDNIFLILDNKDIIGEYAKYDMLIGKETHGGIGNGITKDGKLKIKMPNGKTKLLN